MYVFHRHAGEGKTWLRQRCPKNVVAGRNPCDAVLTKVVRLRACHSVKDQIHGGKNNLVRRSVFGLSQQLEFCLDRWAAIVIGDRAAESRASLQADVDGCGRGWIN